MILIIPFLVSTYIWYIRYKAERLKPNQDFIIKHSIINQLMLFLGLLVMYMAGENYINTESRFIGYMLILLTICHDSYTKKHIKKQEL